MIELSRNLHVELIQTRTDAKRIANAKFELGLSPRGFPGGDVLKTLLIFERRQSSPDLMIGVGKEEPAMGKIDRSGGQDQRAQEQFMQPLCELVREALFDIVIVSGLEYLGEVLEDGAVRTALSP